MITPLVTLALSILALAFASRISVSSGLKISDYFGAKESAIGFLFIAVFTSLPELFIGIFSGIASHPTISLGNVIGSNIANILLVLGAGLLLAGGVKISQKKMLEQVDVLFLISIVPIILLGKRTLDQFDGIIMLVLFLLYVLFIIKTKFVAGKKRRKDYTLTQWFWINVGFWGGLSIVIIASYYAVSSTVELASLLGVPEWLIAISFIALGTSLPELAVDITAIRRGNVGLAIGDILGSCVTNITLVLGVTLLLSPIKVDIHLFLFPVLVLMLTNLWLWYSIIKHKTLGKKLGLAMILGYIFFIMLEFLVRV